MDPSVDLLVGFSRLVANAAEPDEILPRLADAMVHQVPTAGVVVVRVLRSGRLAVAAARNLPEAAKSWEASVMEVGFDIGQELKAYLGESRDAAAHPLVSERDLFGWVVLFLDSPSTPAEAKILQAFGDLAAIAVSQAVRTADLHEAHRRLRDEHAKLVQTEKLSSIGLLASGVAHEINNPLAGVMAALSRLRTVREVGPGEAPYFDLMKEALDRIHTITRNLLDFARQRPILREEVDVDAVVAASIGLARPAALKRSIVLEHEECGAIAVADRGQLMQSLINVLLNAIHASPDRGTVHIDGLRSEEMVGVAVSDQGGGIPESILDKICDPFFTTKAEGEGTGLGLAITLGLIEANHGRLEFGSAPGGGARVTIWLPAQAVHDGAR